jgi:hypothetical protein
MEQGIAAVLQQVPVVTDPDGIGRIPACSIRVGATTATAEDLNPGASLEPCDVRVGAAV